MNDDPAIESPCIKVCALDASGEICLGCLRTLVEIGRWPDLSNRERAAILAKLPARRARVDAGPPSNPAEWAPLRCERCGAGFVCGARDPDHPCWCNTFPAVAPSKSVKSCLCPQCLAAARP
jgi:uncharacterized protein